MSPGGRSTDVKPRDRNNEEAIKEAESRRRDREEVHGRDGLTMVPENGQPPAGRFRVARRLFQPSGNTSLRYVDAEHLQFAMNPGSTPGRVLGHHAEDEFSDFFRQSFSANLLSYLGEEAPVQAKTGGCHRATVSGVTTTRHCFQRDQ